MNTLLQLFLGFVKIGFFGFGGGMAMLPLIGQTLAGVGMTESEFGDLVAISQVTPGPIAVNAATYGGFKAAGVLGSIAATVGVALPCMLMVLVAMHLMKKYKDNEFLKGIGVGIKPAVVGLIAAAVVMIARGVLFSGTHAEPIPCIMFAVTAAVMLATDKVNPIIPMIVMGVIGAFVFTMI